jgi:hypothetical protein
MIGGILKFPDVVRNDVRHGSVSDKAQNPANGFVFLVNFFQYIKITYD